MNITALILAGGKSLRMGQNKAQLKIENTSFLDRIAAELSFCGELLVSVDEPQRHPEISLPMIGDEFPDCGPLSGIYSALKACKGEAILAVSCDLPLFSAALGKKLISAMRDETDAVVPQTLDGRVHPLCAVYSKRCLETFGLQLLSKNYRMRDALDKLNTNYIFAQGFSRALTNVNTPEEYAQICQEEKNREAH